MVYAKKAKSDNIEGGLYQSEIFPILTRKGHAARLQGVDPSRRPRACDRRFSGARRSAARSVRDRAGCGAELVGIGCAVEKGFQGGGDKLRAAGVNLHSLAIIESAEPGNIVFREEA